MKHMRFIASIGKTVARIIQITAIVALAAVAIGCPPEPADPGDGNGDGGGGAATIPATPAGFAATAGDGAITLTWNASSGATSYEIYRGADVWTSRGDEAFATVDSGTTYEDTDLTNGVAYRYAIAAKNSAGTSARSAVITATVGAVIEISVDSDPDMEGDQPIEEIMERAGGAEITVATLRAADAMLAGELTYTITNPTESHPFMLDGNRLIVPANEAIDYETNPSFTISIQANRTGGASGITGLIDIAIAIGNIDDAAPVFGAIPDVIIIENDAMQFATGALTIQATDDIGDDEIAYAFLNSDGTTTAMASGFAIDRATGAISVTTAPMYDTADAAANRANLPFRRATHRPTRAARLPRGST